MSKTVNSNVVSWMTLHLHQHPSLPQISAASHTTHRQQSAVGPPSTCQTSRQTAQTFSRSPTKVPGVFEVSSVVSASCLGSFALQHPQGTVQTFLVLQVRVVPATCWHGTGLQHRLQVQGTTVQSRGLVGMAGRMADTQCCARSFLLAMLRVRRLEDQATATT